DAGGGERGAQFVAALGGAREEDGARIEAETGIGGADRLGQGAAAVGRGDVGTELELVAEQHGGAAGEARDLDAGESATVEVRLVERAPERQRAAVAGEGDAAV